MRERPSTLLSTLAVSRGLRLGLLAVLGALSMGSGGGNPGCDSSDGPDKSDGSCTDVLGTYQLTYKDTSPLDPRCEPLKVTLPRELVLSRRADEILVAQLPEAELSGTYYVSIQDLTLWGDGTVTSTSGQEVPVRISVMGRFDTHPQNAMERTTFQGTYGFSRMDESYPNKTCSFEREFTATR